MVLRQRYERRGGSALGLFLGLLVLPLAARAADPFDCHVSLSDSRQYDLTSLAGEKTVQRERVTPPSTTFDAVRFDLCADLPKKDDVAEADQCPSGTRACLTMTNRKGNSDTDRIFAVIPLAVTDVLQPEFSSLTSPKGLSVLFHGASYPTTNPVAQSFQLSLICNTTDASPTFVGYDGAQLRAEWHTPAGCDFSAPPGAPGSPDKDSDGSNGGGKERVGSGIGWFFLLFLLAFAAYFALGAYYNYSTYGASGLDLIPHRDFWMDVPYLLRDVVAHLCSAIRPNRSGYIAV